MLRASSINTIAVTDHTEWVKPETFPESIGPFVSEKEKEAGKVKRHTNSYGELSLWTDGSKLESECTEACVAWRDPV